MAQVQLVGLVLGDQQARDPAQLVDGIDDADERDAIIALQDLVGPDDGELSLASAYLEHVG